MNAIVIVLVYAVLSSLGGGFANIAPFASGMIALVLLAMKDETGSMDGAWLGIGIAAILFLPSLPMMLPPMSDTHVRDAGDIALEQRQLAQEMSDKGVEIDADNNGHFIVTANIGSFYIPMIVDTGATVVALTYEDAAQMGLVHDGMEFNIPVETANGRAMAAYIILPRIEIRGIDVTGVPAVIAQPGTNAISLLGMSYLRRLTHFLVADDKLILYQKKS